jgi:hypothetical protein
MNDEFRLKVDNAYLVQRIERLEAALREIEDKTGIAAAIARAALAQSSPPAHQENDDVYPGFRGNNEA